MRPVVLTVALAALLALFLTPAPATAAPGDTTWVRTFDEEFINWATPHYGTFTLPPEPTNWSKVVMFLTIGCPPSPGNCDPWDRLGNVRIVTPNQGDMEIARFVTPYDITYAAGPDSCAWTHNVTHYKSYLHDEVELRLYIESWIGGERGWLITIDFAYIEGELELEPYRVVNLWQDDWVEYGNPDDPIESSIVPMELEIPAEAEKVQFRMYATGHGQGNTNNCAEFCGQSHTIVANGVTHTHTLWRGNCDANPCSPQLGTWEYPRAGWCPGDRAVPWTVDITDDVTPGTTVQLDYQVEAYENLCRPGNVNCVNGSTCPDCEYNYNGHTVPIYVLQSQAVFYAPLASVVSADLSGLPQEPAVRLGQNAPNPFNPATTFEYTIDRPADVDIRVVDVQGRTVREVRQHHSTPGTFAHTWNGRDEQNRSVAAGVYFYTIRVEGQTETRRMIRMR